MKPIVQLRQLALKHGHCMGRIVYSEKHGQRVATTRCARCTMRLVCVQQPAAADAA